MNFTRTGRPGTGTSRQRAATVATVMTISFWAKRFPMHCRLPAPNGTNAPFGTSAARSGAQRPGSNRSGSANDAGSWWSASGPG